MDRGVWRATVHRVAKSGTRLKWFSMQHAPYKHIPTDPTNTYLLDFQMLCSQFWVLGTSRSVKQVLCRQLWSGSREWLDFRNTKLSVNQWLMFYPLDVNSAHGNRCSIPFLCSRFLLHLTPTFLCILKFFRMKHLSRVVPLFSASLKYNWHAALCEFKVHNIMVWHTVGHNWSDLACTYAHVEKCSPK